MLRFTDNELTIIRRFAEPLHPNDRGSFLQRVAALLQGVELGDGALHRACQETQLQFRRATAIDGRLSVSGKHGR